MRHKQSINKTIIQAAKLEQSRNEELLKLLRETVMRANFAMPENEQDEKWFYEERTNHEFIIKIFKELKLGNETR